MLATFPCLVASFVLLTSLDMARAQDPIPKLDWAQDWRDGLPTDGIGPADATVDPASLRFWVGQGLALAQIRIDTRTRVILEEDDQPYEQAIRRVLFDEASSGQGDDRLVVLVGAQPKTTPKTPATLFLMDGETPSAPFELANVDLVDSSASGWFYDVSDVCLVPGTQVIAAVGTAQHDTNGAALLVMLFDRQVAQPSGQEQLVKIAELREPLFALQDIQCGETSTQRTVLGLRSAAVHQIGSDLVLFGIAAVSPKARDIEGIVMAVLDPTATLEADRVDWKTATTHVFDAPHWMYCVAAPTPAPDWQAGTVNAITVVADGGSPQKHWLYAAGGSYLRLRELEVTDVVANGFPAPTDMGIAQNEPLRWIESHHDAPTGEDLLLVVGRNHIHAIKRVDPVYPTDYGTEVQKFGENVSGYVMHEFVGGGQKDHLWLVAADTPEPWTIWDVTNRAVTPGVTAPDKVEFHYLPGGNDGAVLIEPWDAIYAGTFKGMVRYDNFDTAGGYEFQPAAASYRSSMLAGTDHPVEQVELAHFGGGDYRLITPNGAGQALVWELDDSTKSIGAPALFAPQWTAWPDGTGSPYSHRATFAHSESLDKDFLLLDFAKLDAAVPQARLGRFLLDPAEDSFVLTEGTWQELDLLEEDTAGLLEGWITDVATSPDGEWAFAGMKSGFVVVRLGAGSSFEVTDVVYTSSGDTNSILDPFGTGRDYTQVEGIAAYRDVVIVNATHADPSNQQPPAAVAMYAFDPVNGLVGGVLAVHEGDVPGETPSGALAGVKLWGGGPVRIHELEPGIARVYVGSNEYGTVVEFELQTDESIADLIPLAYWHNGAHFTQTTDVRPYDDGHGEGRPVVLVSRYQQTIGLVRASELIDPE